jgi:hypothetical protein
VSEDAGMEHIEQSKCTKLSIETNIKHAAT